MRSTCRPATQILARRTVQADRQGREPDAVEATCSPISCRAPAAWRCRSALSTALDAAALLNALDRYPFGCSEQITSRAMPLLYVNELASAAHLALDDADRPAHPRRHRPRCWRGRARTARSGCGRSGGDDVWLDAYVTDFLTRARERGFAVPDDRVQAGARPAAQLRRAPRRSPTRTAAASSPMRSTCWRATAPRRSATCATSPTPSSTTSRRRSPRRRSPRRSAMLGDRTRAERVYTRGARRASRRSPTLEFGRADYGSALRDAAALVTLASEGGAPRPTIDGAVARIEAARGAHAPTPRRRRTPGWCWPRARSAKDATRSSLDVDGETRAGRALPQPARGRADGSR